MGWIDVCMGVGCLVGETVLNCINNEVNKRFVHYNTAVIFIEKLRFGTIDLLLTKFPPPFRYAKLETEFKLHDRSWAEKEVMFMTSLDESQEIIVELNKKFGLLSTEVQKSQMSRNFSDTEVKGELVLRDKQIQALKIELKASNMELRSLKMLDAQKTKLMALMERKIVSLKEKNVALSAQPLGEDVAATGSSGGGGEFSVEDKNILEKNLEDAETLNANLRTANKELKLMLRSIEDKGAAISKVSMVSGCFEIY